MGLALRDVLVEAGFNVEVISRNFSSDASEVGHFSFRKARRSIAILSAVVRAHRPNVVVFFVTNRTFAFLIDTAIGVVLRMRGIPYISYVHTNGYSELAARGGVWQRLAERLLSRSEFVVALSRSLASDVEPLAGGTPVRIIPNFVDRDPRAVMAATSGRVRVVFLSNLLPEKGPELFIRLAQSPQLVNVDVEFILAGGTSDASYARKLEARAHATRVSLSGAVAGEDKRELLATSDVFVFPSIYKFEAQPLVVIEALAYGCAVIASDVGAVPDLVPAGAGIVTPAGDVAAMANALCRLISNRQELAEMKAFARITHERVHTRQAFADAWEGLVSHAISSASGGGDHA